MRLATALASGLLLLAASWVLRAQAGAPGELRAIIGSTGVVLGASLLVLTTLAWRWRGPRSYSDTVVDPSFYDELATAFDETTEGYDDGQSLRAAR